LLLFLATPFFFGFTLIIRTLLQPLMLRPGAGAPVEKTHVFLLPVPRSLVASPSAFPLPPDLRSCHLLRSKIAFPWRPAKPVLFLFFFFPTCFFPAPFFSSPPTALSFLLPRFLLFLPLFFVFHPGPLFRFDVRRFLLAAPSAVWGRAVNLFLFYFRLQPGADPLPPPLSCSRATPCPVSFRTNTEAHLKIFTAVQALYERLYAVLLLLFFVVPSCVYPATVLSYQFDAGCK